MRRNKQSVLNSQKMLQRSRVKDGVNYTKREGNFKLVVVSGIPFWVRLGTCDEGVLGEVIISDVYHINKIELRNNPNIVDVGGHIGGFTKRCAWKWPNGSFYVYEANPRNFNIIEKNLNDIKEKVTLYKGALVGEKPINEYLVIDETAMENTGGWGILFDEEKVEINPNASEKIGDFFYASDLFPTLDKVDILKLDCEGSEFSILKHMTDEELDKVDYLVLEVHCGALEHHPWTYKEFRDRILKQFVCPGLESRPTVGPHDLFNVIAYNRKLF